MCEKVSVISQTHAARPLEFGILQKREINMHLMFVDVTVRDACEPQGSSCLFHCFIKPNELTQLTLQSKVEQHEVRLRRGVFPAAAALFQSVLMSSYPNTFITL